MQNFCKLFLSVIYFQGCLRVLRRRQERLHSSFPSSGVGKLSTRAPSYCRTSPEDGRGRLPGVAAAADDQHIAVQLALPGSGCMEE